MEFAPCCHRDSLHSALAARWCHSESEAGAPGGNNCCCGIDNAGANRVSSFVRHTASRIMAVAGIGGDRNCAASAMDAVSNFTHGSRRSSRVSRAPAAFDFRICDQYDCDTNSRRFTFRCSRHDAPPCRSMDRCRHPVVRGRRFAASARSVNVDARADVYERQPADDSLTAAVVQHRKSRAERTMDHQQDTAIRKFC